MNHRPRKRFGQNFLHNQLIIGQILAALNLQRDDNMVEIGPGMGALTKPLLQRLNKLTAIEIDRDLHTILTNSLSSFGLLQLIGADALTIDFSQLGTGLRVIGNLPYNISTPLMLHLLNFADNISDMHFMLQKEVAYRLAGVPGTKDYGRLSIMMQYHCQVEYLFDVPPTAFHPQPKVDSAMIRLIPYRASPFPNVPTGVLESLVATAFSMRRKTLANNLKRVLNAAELNDLGIDPGLRPEQISIMDYVKLSNYISNSVEFK